MVKRSNTASTVSASKSMMARIGSAIPASGSGGRARRTVFRSLLNVHIVRSLISIGIMSFGSIGSSLASRRGTYWFPRRTMDMPGEQAATARTAKVVAGAPVDDVPGRLVDRHMLDLPRRQAGGAEEESQSVFAADWQQHGGLDFD